MFLAGVCIFFPLRQHLDRETNEKRTRRALRLIRRDENCKNNAKSNELFPLLQLPQNNDVKHMDILISITPPRVYFVIFKNNVSKKTKRIQLEQASGSIMQS